MPSLRRTDEKRLLDLIEKSYSNQTPYATMEVGKNQMKTLSAAFDRVYVFFRIHRRLTRCWR